MYHSLLSNQFKLQTRISWDNQKAKISQSCQFGKTVSQILVCYQIFRVYVQSEACNEIQNSEDLITNFWGDILFLNSPPDTSLPDDKPSKVIEHPKSIKFWLNWVVDPFARTGYWKNIKENGKKVHGFEIDKDKLILQ